MTQQNSDNKPPATTKLLKFTGRSGAPETGAQVARNPEELVGQALAVAIFDAGANAKVSSSATIASIGAFVAPGGKKALVLRSKDEVAEGAAVAPLVTSTVTTSKGSSSQPKKKPK